MGGVFFGTQVIGVALEVLAVDGFAYEIYDEEIKEKRL